MVRRISTNQLYLPEGPDGDDLRDDIDAVVVLPDWDPEPYDEENDDD